MSHGRHPRRRSAADALQSRFAAVAARSWWHRGVLRAVDRSREIRVIESRNLRRDSGLDEGQLVVIARRSMRRARTPVAGGAMRTCRLFVVLVAMIAAARPMAAQIVSGIVLLPDGVTPASSVIIVANDDHGTETSRTLSNVRGEYTLRFAGPARVSLKALRIGFRPTKGPIIDVAATGTTSAPKIILAADAVSLTAVNIRDRETCRVNADTGLMVARVWEEAQKAMSSTQLGNGAAPLFAEWIEYDQSLDSSARLVRAQRVRTSRNATTHAFKSRPVAFLDTAGYIVVENGEAMYFAPDADVLLSELFAAHHCFRL